MASMVDDKTWNRLLRAFKCLGIMHHQSILVLPLCAEGLRDIIWWRYITSQKMEQQYHQYLVGYFTLQTTSFRKAEELPWHLQHCLKFSLLKDVLVDISMFRLLFTTDFKAELFGYWQTLSEENAHDVSAMTSTSRYLQKKMRQQSTVEENPIKLSGYDVVKEYARGVDQWIAANHPPMSMLTSLLNLVRCRSFYANHDSLTRW